MSPNNQSSHHPSSDFEALLRGALGPPNQPPLDLQFRQQLAFEAGRAEGKRTAWRWVSGGLVCGFLLGMLGTGGGWPIPHSVDPTLQAPVPQMAKTPDKEPMENPKTLDSPNRDNPNEERPIMARALPLSKSSIWNPLTDLEQVNRSPLAPSGTQYISTGTTLAPQYPPTNLRSISNVMEDLK